ncbi:PAP2 superfamily protein (macronuclear) [Tetrahymena thermophila SB210]|uniref:PAP2 superfamily protein n=1 Tax=Tetrahymena thermophila (strain SB210) TaxID=312017 RepID=I7LWN5_TETTS|nr:PAP2 superfamily protein [Tetrahymena thermophila SB210]EAS02418.2 PAP2 superfamily protein [Tetrahymena thermophila SB210]|eukprot:XP_001022663.2 PAP2 superfamily protein [Tetrahymena thermophila SB210]
MSSFIMSLLKIWYHEPRPYFIYTDLISIGCEQEFAKPSGHTLGSTVFYYLVFDSLINRKFFIVSKQSEKSQEIMNLPKLYQQKLNSNNPQNSQQIIDEEKNIKQTINDGNCTLIVGNEIQQNNARCSFLWLSYYCLGLRYNISYTLQMET